MSPHHTETEAVHRERRVRFERRCLQPAHSSRPPRVRMLAGNKSYSRDGVSCSQRGSDWTQRGVRARGLRHMLTRCVHTARALLSARTISLFRFSHFSLSCLHARWLGTGREGMVKLLRATRQQCPNVRSTPYIITIKTCQFGGRILWSTALK